MNKAETHADDALRYYATLGKAAGLRGGMWRDILRNQVERPLASAPEPAWSLYLAAVHAGTAEYLTIDNSRCDILTDRYAIEVEWVKKWHQAIGQSLHYSILTGRRPKIILLLRGHDHENRYLDRCRMVCERAGIELETVLTVDRSDS